MSNADDGLQACADAATALASAGVQPEALAEYVPPSTRLLVLKRPATMRPMGTVWRVGALLLSADFRTNMGSTNTGSADAGILFAAGRATRAAHRGRVGYQSVSREERRDIAAAALRGGYPEGAPVNFDAVPLSLTRAELEQLGPASPIGWAADAIRVRWRPGARLDDAPSLETYLSERVHLLINPEP